MTSREFHKTALAMATDWRWPPERVATGWRMDRTVVTFRPLRVAASGGLHGVLVEGEVPAALPPEEHVLDDVEVVAQGEVLVHGLDAEGGGVGGRADVDAAAVPPDLAAVRPVRAGDGLDEH